LFLYFQMSLRELYLLSAFQQFQFNFVLFFVTLQSQGDCKDKKLF
jgi:hypothetical protein